MTFVLFTWISKTVIGEITAKILGTPNRELIFLSYVSPTILGCAVCLVGLFYHIRLHERVKLLVSFMAPAAFGVYLFHEQPIIASQVLKGSFVWITELPGIVVPSVVLGISILIFAIGISIDKLRAILFKMLKIDVLAKKIEKLLRRTFQKFAEYFSCIIVE